MRHISASLTTRQFREHIKDVTRRYWKHLPKPGELFQVVVKGQGLKKGEKVEKICVIRVLDARWETLERLLGYPEYGKEEARCEGFPEMTHREFYAFFVASHKGKTGYIARIEFEYVD